MFFPFFTIGKPIDPKSSHSRHSLHQLEGMDVTSLVSPIPPSPTIANRPTYTPSQHFPPHNQDPPIISTDAPTSFSYIL